MQPVHPVDKMGARVSTPLFFWPGARRAKTLAGRLPYFFGLGPDHGRRHAASGVLGTQEEARNLERRLGALIRLRDKARRVLQSQNEDWPEAGRVGARKDLNWAYDCFVMTYGPINKTTTSETRDGGTVRRMPNLVKFREDPDAMLVMSLGQYDEATGKAAKAAIMVKDVVGRNAPVTSVQTAEEGLLVSLDRRGAVDLLRAYGVARVVMLTGDSAGTAAAVAAELGVDEYRAELLPEDKVAAIDELRRAHGPVAMVGDGVNDAPALASADVGIAMGVAGSDAALETADVALMADDLLKIPYALRLSRATMRNIRANLAISIVMKAAFVAMAVGGWATLWMAIVADTGASIIVIANALRLLRAD